MFPHIFVANTKIIFSYIFGAPLNFYYAFCRIRSLIINKVSKIIKTLVNNRKLIMKESQTDKYVCVFTARKMFFRNYISDGTSYKILIRKLLTSGQM